MDSSSHQAHTIYQFIPIFFLILLTFQIKAQDPKRDSAALYSSSELKPFKYGRAYTKKECEEILPDLIAQYDFKKGEIVGDVGAASGWLDGAFAVLTDSITFYIQDINVNYLNQTEFEKVVQYFTKIREHPQTNKFYYVLGTEKKTNLPDSIFDKIIFHNSFHEIRPNNAFLKDVKKKLKPNGKIMIHEGFSNSEKLYPNAGCNILGYQVSDIELKFKKIGYYLTNSSEPLSSFTNHLTFEADKQKSNAFKKKLETVDSISKQLLKLYTYKTALDSNKTKTIGLFLKNHLTDYSNVFPVSMESSLNTLGYVYLKENDVKEAINIFRVSVQLFPLSFNVYDSLGEAYMKKKKYAIAIWNYKKSFELNPKNFNAKDKISEIQELIDWEKSNGK